MLFVISPVWRGLRHLISLHTADLSWQTRAGEIQKVGKLISKHVKLTTHGNLQYGRLLKRMTLT